ncbi:MAG: iron chelate uptake ABC transporter family permease subunit [Armatimonadetes bacterium]|nr:iron chelate uptake ABC transporter family permease subunit [Armatimonadota bacterium]
MTSLRRRRRVFYCFVALVIALGTVAGGIVAVVVGPSGQPLPVVLDALGDGARNVVFGESYPRDPAHTIVLDIRLPRVLLGCLVGASLALAGAVMQALFQNAMADPYIVGVSGGAALGAVAAMMLNIQLRIAGFTAVPILAFVGALATTVTVYVLAQRGGRVHTATLLLTGIAIGSLVSAVTSFLMLSRDELQPGVIFWLLGSLSGRSWLHVYALVPQLVMGLVVAVVMARPLNVLVLGDEAALNLGLDVQRTKRWLLGLSALLAASAVAVSGIIGFVGLIVPHVCRLIVGPDHRVLLPISALAGALLLVLADIPARMALAPTELPIGIITSLLGCPFFLYLLHRQGTRGL